MADAHKLHTIAVINANDDIIDALRLLLEDEGFHAVGEHLTNFKRGRSDFIAFCQEHEPEVVVLDIGPPYEENWTFFKLLKDSKVAEGRKFILTTTNKRALEQVAGKIEVHEILGKPFDIEEVVAMVKRALKSKEGDR